MERGTVGNEGSKEGTYNLGNVRVIQRPGSFEASRRPKGAMGYFFIFFGGFWSLFTALFLVSVLSAVPSGSFDWSGLLIAIPMLIFGLFMLYLGMVSAFNRSVIRIESGRLTRENKPLPWLRVKILQHI